MRAWLAGVGVAAAMASAPAMAAPDLDSVLARAALADKPVVLELGATWCKPCKMFDAQVLPRPEVRRALDQVVLVAYDLDTPEGEVVAQRYSVTAVPAFIVVAGRDGGELERVLGLPSPAAFVALVERAPGRGRLGLALQRAVDHDTTDVAARLRLAEFDRAAGRSAEAAVQYREIIVTKDVDPITLARTRAALERIETAWSLRRGLDDDLVELSHRPGTHAASMSLARLAVAHRVAAPKLRALAVAHLQHLVPAHWDELGEAVRSAFLAGAQTEAIATLTQWHARAPQGHPAIRIADADIAMYRGDWALARHVIDQLCRPAPTDYELACYARRATLAGAEHALLPGIGHLAAATDIALHGITPDPGSDLEALADLEPTFGRALAAALLDASAACSPVSAVPQMPTIVFEAAVGSSPRIVMIRDTHDAPLARCLREALATHALPPAPPGAESLALPLDVAAQPPAPIELAEPAPRPVDADVVAFAAFRTGAVETRGVGAHGLIDVTRLDHLRLVALGQAELGAGDRDPSFVAHAMIGAGYVSSLFGVWSIAGGFGASRYSDMTPAAIEFPIQVRLGFSLFGVRAAMWGQSVVFPQEARRQEHRLGGDEISFGLGASVPRTHVFVGAMVEDRVGGTAAVVLVGVPFVLGR